MVGHHVQEHGVVTAVRGSVIDVEFAEQSAPSGVWPRIEQRLFTDQAKGGWWNSLALWRSVAAKWRIAERIKAIFFG